MKGKSELRLLRNRTRLTRTNLLKHGHPLFVEVEAVAVHWRWATRRFLAKENTVTLKIRNTEQRQRRKHGEQHTL